MGTKSLFDSSLPSPPYTGGTDEFMSETIEEMKVYNLRYFSQAFLNDKLNCDTILTKQSGHTILHEVIVRGGKDIFRLCEIYGADWNRKDVLGVTPLMKAAAQGNVYFMEQLLKNGAQKDLQDLNGNTAKDYAELFGEDEAYEYLVQQ